MPLKFAENITVIKEDKIIKEKNSISNEKSPNSDIQLFVTGASETSLNEITSHTPSFNDGSMSFPSNSFIGSVGYGNGGSSVSGQGSSTTSLEEVLIPISGNNSSKTNSTMHLPPPASLMPKRSSLTPGPLLFLRLMF